ncbi:single-stranded-DNA-specific exonuclease RecJ [Candidatus Omnitrophota bacterium]
MIRWNIRKPDKSKSEGLSESLGVSPIIAQLLINRGINDVQKAKTFLNGGVSELYDPFLMEGMRESVERLKKAIEKKEKILIHGDYDVDGITAISVLVFTLRDFGIDPVYYIPDRITEGYGLSEAGVKEAIKNGVSLVVTVDCGISSFEEVKALNEHGIDVIITDHHEPPKVLPPAYSIINPHKESCAYPDKNLSGVSVAFKLCEALCSGSDNKNIWKHLDLVSLGTISDVAPLTGENRILVKEGLKLLGNGTSNKGLKALVKESGLKKKVFGSFDIGFILGPRINAAGRIGRAQKAVELLLTADSKKAHSLAKLLNDANRERQRIEGATLKEALFKIEKEVNFKEHKVIVLHNEDWHTGVIGIVASRISDRFYRPTILVSTKDGMGRGSGRSIEGFHLFEALVNCSSLLKEYGGHKYACGLTIPEKNLDNFRNTINKIASSTIIPKALMPHIDIDMEVKLSSLGYDLVGDLSILEPFGAENPRPVLCSKNLRLTRPPRVLKRNHIKLWVTDGTKDFEAIGFGLAKDTNNEEILKNSSEIDLAYTASINTWQGLDTIQLKIEDIRPS